MTQTAKIIYHCYKRRGHFIRNVLLDDGPDPLEKIAGLQFRTQHYEGIDIVFISMVGSRNAKNAGISVSLPAHLFGQEFYRSQRVDTTNLWDWRKKAFVLPMTRTEDRLMKLFA